MHIAVPLGFKFSGVSCGIKAGPNKRDLSLITCTDGSVAAGVYTKNLVVAAPVIIDRERTPSEDVRAIVINSGNANACTGERGMQDAIAMTEHAAVAIDCAADQVLVMSTGIIGEPLPMKKIEAGISMAAAALSDAPTSLEHAAEGILTTDDCSKLASRTAVVGDTEIALTGIAKGAGMIGPNMATMLAVLMTDARLEPPDAQAVLTASNAVSFNCVSVDGHMSTNDSCVLLASGAASPSPLRGADLEQFAKLVEQVCIELARQIANDGEGASHLIQIDVRGCATAADAHQIAKTIANSPLVKTACTGADPNWGRIVSAAGYAGPVFDPAGVSLSINGSKLYEHGAPVEFDAQSVSQSMAENREIEIDLSFSEGTESARFWTSDLTAEYIRINAEYHT